jgi:alkanesulfonate monooxygenase SsuD/methylene tetrahydromethanopterin reductase-like flavin-dependent oxidoreductase (luciferase family)
LPKLSFGLSLNNRAAVFLQEYKIDDLLRMAELADQLPFESVWVGDSLIDTPRYEPLVLLGAIATKTTKVKIGGSIIQPHFRNPVLFALSWATLDMLSNGRTILTLGIGGGTPGGVAKEASLVGLDVRKRGRCLEEYVEILRVLWKGETLNFSGEIYKFQEAKLGYFPVQRPPPIWIAAGVYIPRTSRKEISATPGFTKKNSGTFSGGFERVGRLADGWFTIMASPNDFRESSEKVTEFACRYGRRPDEIHRGLECWINVNSSKETARDEITDMIRRYFGQEVDPETVERWSIYGTQEDCIKQIEEYAGAGVETLKLIMGSPDQLSMMNLVSESILNSF